MFSHVVKHASIRIFLSLVVQFDMFLAQLDVKTDFLQVVLEKVIYMGQPKVVLLSG